MAPDIKNNTIDLCGEQRSVFNLIPLGWSEVRKKDIMIQGSVGLDEKSCHLEPVSQTFLSSDVHLPDHLPRVTQTNIGQYLVADVPPKDISYGTHYTEYGGIGDHGIQEGKLVTGPTIPRSHSHFKSGVKEREPTAHYVDPRILERLLERNKACFVDPPGKNAPYLYEMFKKYSHKTTVDSLQKSKFNIFPRSEQLELSYIEAHERAGRLRPDTRLDYLQACDRLTCGKPQEQLGTRRKVSSVVPPWWHFPPFWWDGSPFDTPGPMGDPSDYSYTGLDIEKLEHQYPRNLREEIQVERPERYIPGQVHTKGPIDTRRPCQCPAVPLGSYGDRSPYTTFRGPGHWPASAMEERRHYANRGHIDNEDKTVCPLYEKVVGDTMNLNHKGASGDMPCPYYTMPSYITQGVSASNKNTSDCICPSAHERLSKDDDVAPCLHYTDNENKGQSVCQNEVQHLSGLETRKSATCSAKGTIPQCMDASQDGVRPICPVEQGRPLPTTEGILRGDSCYETTEKQRKMQMHKVGMPFRTEACRWYNHMYPLYKPDPVGKPSKKVFPEMRFSNL